MLYFINRCFLITINYEFPISFFFCGIFAGNLRTNQFLFTEQVLNLEIIYKTVNTKTLTSFILISDIILDLFSFFRNYHSDNEPPNIKHSLFLRRIFKYYIWTHLGKRLLKREGSKWENVQDVVCWRVELAFFAAVTRWSRWKRWRTALCRRY